MQKILLLLCGFLLFLLCACNSGGPAEPAVYQKITAEQAKEIIDGTEPCILLDVRTQEEFDESHIDGAILIPDYAIGDQAQALLPDKNALLLLYCRSGRRSELAANELLEMGYTSVYDFGGIIDWTYDTVSG